MIAVIEADDPAVAAQGAMQLAVTTYAQNSLRGTMT